MHVFEIMQFSKLGNEFFYVFYKSMHREMSQLIMITTVRR